jgi:hypothetical protein
MGLLTYFLTFLIGITVAGIYSPSPDRRCEEMQANRAATPQELMK